jgi:hypothetical protein
MFSFFSLIMSVAKAYQKVEQQSRIFNTPF